jgi:hypothetical protein
MNSSLNLFMSLNLRKFYYDLYLYYLLNPYPSTFQSIIIQSYPFSFPSVCHYHLVLVHISQSSVFHLNHPVSSPISQQQSTGNSYASNIYQQQPYSNGSTYNMQPFSSHQGYQTSQYYTPYSAQQYQNTPWNRGYYVQNSYVAPWATRFKQPQSPHQNVVTHGSEGYSSASQVLPVSSSYPPPPWTAGSLEPVPQSINSQQRAMLYGKCLISIRRIHLLRNN